MSIVVFQTKKLAVFLLDIFFPVKCLNCGKYGAVICFDCAKEIATIETLTCPDCGKISESGQYCSSCKSNRDKVFLKGLLVASHYDEGPLKEMIHQFKYGNLTSLAEPLGELICQQIADKIPAK